MFLTGYTSDVNYPFKKTPLYYKIKHKHRKSQRAEVSSSLSYPKANLL